MRIAYDNLILAATAPTAVTEDSAYPVTNVQNQRLAKVWRSTSTTGQTIVCDIGSAQDVNTVAILGHNFTSSATLEIQANTANTWVTPGWSTALTCNEGVILKFLAASQTYQYWRYTIEDSTQTDAYVEVGLLWLGTYLTIDPSSLLNFTVTKKRSDTVVYGRDRQKYATEGVGWRSFDLSFPRTGGTALTNVLTMYDTAGNHSSVIFCNFDSDRSYEIVEPCYCSIEGEIDFRHTRYMDFEWSLKLEEDR